MGARLINSPRRTKIGHVEAFPVLHMRSLRKSAMFSEGQRTEGHFRYPGASNAITIIVDLRSEHDLKVLLKVGHADSATNMQVIGLTHRPTGFNGRRWYFVSTNGERAETLFLVGGFFRTRREAGLTYRSQSQGELDRALDLKTPGAARGYRRSRASKGTATQAGRGETGANSALTGRFRIGPGASRPKQACAGSRTAAKLIRKA